MKIAYQPSHLSWNTFRVSKELPLVEFQVWAQESIKSDWSTPPQSWAKDGSNSHRFCFEDKQDAMLFKLVWSAFIMRSIFT